MFENGMEYVRADFHLHTCKDKEFLYSGEENNFVKDYIAALSKANIRVGVITNHNKFDIDEYNAIRKAAKKEDIFILPGVELAVKEGANGIHTLIVFNPEEWLCNGDNQIQTFLTTVFTSISHPENSNTKCNDDLKTILDKLDGYGKDYFIIFAHVDQKSGLFYECKGGVFETIARLPSFKKRVVGLQKARTRDNIENFKKYFNYVPALVEGSDPKSISEIGKGDKQTYLKMGDYSFSAVKFSLQDYKNRVFDNSVNLKHGYIKSIFFQGGKLDGQTINLSSSLNTLIGIRGSGKSSIIETIRYVFGLPSQADKTYKDDLVKSVLGSGGKVTLSIVDKYGKEYQISRIYKERVNVLDSEGNDLNISPLSLFDGVQYFGQKDLSNSADNENGLLEKLVSGKIEKEAKPDGFTENIVELIKQLLEVHEIPEQIESVKNSISEIEHKRSIYKEKGADEKLKKQTAYTLDKVQFDSIKENTNNIIQKYKTVYKENKIVSDNIQNYISEYNEDLISEIKDILFTMDEQLCQIGSSVDKLEERYEDLKNIIVKFEERVESLTDEFAEIKREIDDDLDMDGYVKLTEQLGKSKAELAELEKKKQSKSEIEKQLKRAVRNRNDMLLKTFNAYEDEVTKINQSQNEIKVKLTFKGDKNAFKIQMQNDFKGTSISENKYQVMSEKFSDYLDLIVDWILQGGKELLEVLTPGEYSKLDERLRKQYKSLVECPVKNKVEIYYHGKSLKQHSIGQRASALVLFILTQDDNDIIIIDQPEDDLDNKVIYDEVITAIMEKKPGIQFIFATHNANIPVLGDAEKVITTEYENGSINVDAGNIDLKSTHKEIIDIMEGGEEAFNKRQLIYTNWK